MGKGCCLVVALIALSLQTTNAAPTTGSDEPHCDWPNGQIYWSHPSDCHKFIQCTPHGPQEMRCAPGTAWSQSLLTCDHEVNVDCSPPPPSCPEPFRMRGDECFFVTEDGIEPLNWDDSRQKCLDMGADLAQPQDMVDFVEYIKESYNNSKSTIWLGATDREVEQDWYWVSGEPVPPAMWEPWPHNQPSGDGNCMEIHWWPKTGFYMNDWHCHNKGHFACEFSHILENDDVEDTSSETDIVEDNSSEGSGVEDTPCDWPTGQQYWPHPTNCRMFVQCTSYGPQEMHCAPGTAWTQSLLACDFNFNTGCGEYQPTSPPEAISTSPPKAPSSAPPPENKETSIACEGS